MSYNLSIFKGVHLTCILKPLSSKKLMDSLNLPITHIEGGCQDGWQCKAIEDCPAFAEKQSQLRTFERFSPARRKLLEELQNLVCNKREHKVCCKTIFFLVKNDWYWSIDLIHYCLRMIFFSISKRFSRYPNQYLSMSFTQCKVMDNNSMVAD